MGHVRAIGLWLALSLTPVFAQPMTVGELGWPKHRRDSFNPTNSAVIWWDAHTNSGMVFNDLGTNLASNGQLVEQWNDRKGHHNLIQEDGALRPIYADNGNGYYTVAFVNLGSQSLMTNAPGGTIYGQPYTVVMLADPSGASPSALFSSAGVTITEDPTLTNVTINAGTALATTNSLPPGATSYHIVSSVFDGASSYIQYRQTRSVSGNAGSGALSNSLTLSGVADIYEVLVYNRALNSNQLWQVESYLTNKYAL